MTNCLQDWDLPAERVLCLPTVHQPRTSDAALHTLPTGEDVYLLTPSGREILAGLIAAQPPWTQYPETFVDAIGELGGGLRPGLDVASWQFHFINLLWRLRPLAFRRSDLAIMMRAMSVSMGRTRHREWFPDYSEDADVIQAVNKSGQWGLAHQSFKAKVPLENGMAGGASHYYTLAGPLTYDRSNRKEGTFVQPPIPVCNCDTSSWPDDPPIPPTNRALAAEREIILNHLKATWLNVPLSDWTLEGHRDPTNKATSGLVAQPRQYNRKMQNTYKFDRYGLPSCPSVGHLLDRFDNFYPSDDEKVSILVYLLEQLKHLDTPPTVRSEIRRLAAGDHRGSHHEED